MTHLLSPKPTLPLSQERRRQQDRLNPAQLRQQVNLNLLQQVHHAHNRLQLLQGLRRTPQAVPQVPQFHHHQDRKVRLVAPELREEKDRPRADQEVLVIRIQEVILTRNQDQEEVLVDVIVPIHRHLTQKTTWRTLPQPIWLPRRQRSTP